MGSSEPDKCMFCETDLEDWDYEYYKENGERAENPISEYDTFDICKGCIHKLKQILGITQIKGAANNG